MQVYPGYLMNSNNVQFQQPMYQNPYQERMSHLQSFQQQVNPAPMQYAGLNGRIVDDFNMITANDVPMDGNGAVFIKRDGSEIQLRNWTSNGTIATSRFKPIESDETENSMSEQEKLKFDLSESVMATFEERFDKMDSKLERLDKLISKNSGPRARKEGNLDE